MLATGGHRRRLGRRSGAVSLAILCSAATAASAGAASLKISVPAHVRKGAAYTIGLSGHYRRSELTGTAYLISLIQFSGAPCKPTAQREDHQLSSDLLQFYFAPPNALQKVGISVNSSPLHRVDSFTAGRLGRRHVCAYLYPRFINATSSTAPIATADRAYRVTRT